MADFTPFWNTDKDGLFFMSAASFHNFGKLNNGNLFTEAKWWAGICIQIVGISQFDVWVAHSVCYPCFIERKGQFTMDVFVHEF